MSKHNAYQIVDDMFHSLYINNDGFFNELGRDRLCKVKYEVKTGPCYWTNTDDETYYFDGFQALNVFPIKYIVIADIDIVFFDVNFNIIYRYDLRR